MNWFQAWCIRVFGTGPNIGPTYTGYQPMPAPVGPVVNPIVPVPVPLGPVVWPTSDAATVAAATAWMEDSSGGKDGMQAVLNVVCNRANNARWWGSTIYTVCMKPLQFSCWNKGSTNIVRFTDMLANNPDDAAWAIARNLSVLAISNALPDITLNADSYYSPSALPQGAPPPFWVDDAVYTGEFGANKYYRLYLPPPTVNPKVA